jgi:glycyl-tRNA synthetase
MAEPKQNEQMEKIVSLCKRRGFIFPSSEIYGGIQGFWDYGPLGAELKRNVKDAWWTTMTRLRDDVVGLEATIIMAPQIWRASGHVDTFSDPMCDCLLTKKRFRADQVEPQSGLVYRYAGALDREYFEQCKASTGGGVDLASDRPFGNQLFATTVAGKESGQKFSVLLTPGKPPESARKTAVLFYQSRGIKDPVLVGEKAEKVENSQGFNPENGAELTEPVPFNLMFKTYVGPTATEADLAYLRPETAQAIFVQFKNVHETSRQKVPFGIAQTGKAFRNEVTPRNYIFRSREFEQMELEFFIKPDEAVEAICGRIGQYPEARDPSGSLETENCPPITPQPDWGWEAWHKYWVEERIAFYEAIGLPRTSLEEYWQKPEELAHYARATVDLLFKFPFGTQELEGIAARSDFDLSQHERHSGKTMGVFDEDLRTGWAKLDDAKKKELSDRYYNARLKYLVKAGVDQAKAEADAKEDAEGLAKGQYIPHVIEPSAGVDRLILALLSNAFSEVTTTDDKGKSETRVILKFHPRIAPIKVGVFPLMKNKPEMVLKARAVFQSLRGQMNASYDEAGAIGRRYARQDEAGTPYCITIDFDTLGEKPELLDTVTIRHRDDGKQERLPIAELLPWLLARVR